MSDLTFNPRLPEHCNMDDRVCVNILVDEILSRGKAIRVFDGEEWVLDLCTDKTKILESLSHAGEDTIDTDEGGFYVIYNNGSEGEPMILISDYTDSVFNRQVYRAVEKKIEVAS
tara:strand:- start:37 stop:381 length:345 start_codon:yes stop_codon:yes gene_type:complete